MGQFDDGTLYIQIGHETVREISWDGGHRRIAADLARPAITVRRWLRAVRGEHAEWLRAAAIDRLAQLDRGIISTLAPTGSRLGDALNAGCGRARPPRPAGPARADLGPGCRGDPLAAAAPARRLKIGSGRVLARPQAGATMTTTRHLADHHRAP